MKLFYIFLTVYLLLFSQQTKAVEKIEVQALMPGMVVLLIDGNRITLKTGGHSQGVKLISSTTQTAVLEVDGEQKSYQMGTTVSTSFRPREVITERVIIDNYGMFRSFGSINGHSVKFLVDTGASTVAMSAKDARSLGIQYQLEGTPTQASTASGLAKAWSVQLKTVRLGQLLEHNVRGMVVDGDYPRQILLGMTFLNRMKVEKDGNTMSIISEK
ncbi:MAG: TIGR02281 family clan AA aspartic protease [Gammaproteobacteria bacterium]|nr:TIGR02281 family clan AA aspartic protease [Gammaproteobacteria bacterium]